MKKWNLVFSAGSLLLLIASVLACSSPAPTAAPPAKTNAAPAPTTAAPAGPGGLTYIKMATTTPGGTNEAAAIAFSGIVNKYSDAYRINLTHTKGSEESAVLMQQGQFDIGCLSTPTVFAMFKGTEGFAGKASPDLRYMWTLSGSVMHLVVTKDSPIKAISDLKGKKLALTEPGTVGVVAVKKMLQLSGLDIEKDFAKVFYLKKDDARSAVLDGTADTYMDIMGVASAMQDMFTSKDMRLLPIPQDINDKLVAGGQYAYRTIKAGTYKGLTQDLSLFGQDNYFCTMARLDEKVAYALAKVYWDHKAEADQIHVVIKDQQLADEGVRYKNLPCPVHPGVLKYFKEAGAIK